MDFVLDVEVLWNFSFETNKKSEDEEEKKKMNNFFPKSDDEEEDGKKICINKFNTAFY